MLSCIATQAPGHFAQGWELPYSCLFRAVPGTRHRTTLCLPHAEATLLRCMQRQLPGDSVEGGSAPSLEKVAEVASGMAGDDRARFDPRRPEWHHVCVAGQALRPIRPMQGLSSTAVRENTLRRGSQGLQGPWATRLCNMHCILVLLPWGTQPMQHSGRLHVYSDLRFL